MRPSIRPPPSAARLYLLTPTACGMDAYAGTDFVHAGDPDSESADYLDTDCGWTFGGYTASLYDHPDNVAAWDPDGLGACGPSAGGALGYHLSATSVSNVYLANHQGGTWRLYFPDPVLLASCSELTTPYPNRVYGYSDSTRLPPRAEWVASGRFNQLYISFLDSSDGATYPFYGPRMAEDGSWSGSCPTRWTADDWSEAGWTATAVPVFTGANSADPQLDPDRDGVYVVYRDVSVVDVSSMEEVTVEEEGGGIGYHDTVLDPLGSDRRVIRDSAEDRAEASGRLVSAAAARIRARASGGSSIGPILVTPDPEPTTPVLGRIRELYLMVCIETRGTGPFPQSRGVGDCEATSSCIAGCSLPFTRVVLFFSESPDFDAANIVPDPGVAADALVLLAPDTPAWGAGPESFNPSDPDTCPSEWYGVIHALLTPDGESLLVYVPHVGSTPARTTERYDCALYEINGGSWPVWQNSFIDEAGNITSTGSGISCFRLPVANMRDMAFAVLDSDTGFDREAALSALRAWLRGAMSGVGEVDLGYQGEVLITDGWRTAGPDGAETDLDFTSCSGTLRTVSVPSSEDNTDPQWVFCGSQLYVYWDINNTGEVEGIDRAEGTDGQVHTRYPQDQLRRARWVTVDDLTAARGNDFTDVLRRNRDYTVFLADPADCQVAFDARELFNPGVPPADWDSNVAPNVDSDGAYGPVVADPSLTVLTDGRMVVHHFGGCNTPSAAPGLLFSYTRSSAC